MDPLADILDICRVSGSLMANVTARAPWGLDIPASPGAALHAVTSGVAWVDRGDEAPLRLTAGDVIVLPRGDAHRVRCEPDAPCRPWDRSLKAEMMSEDGTLDFPGPGARTTFVCGGFGYDVDVAAPLLSSLPELLHVSAGPGEDAMTAQFVRALAAESVGPARRAPGAGAVVDRLIDLLFVAALRSWIASGDPLPPGWAQAYRDPEITAALALLHGHPERPWTVAALAAEVHLSRATFARRFHERVGQPPLGYLTGWRMTLAARRLKDGDEPIAGIARSLGYSSEYTFSRAFSRHHGVAPGRYRRGAGDEASWAPALAG